LGSSKVKEDGILASASGVGFRFVFVCGAAMELEKVDIFQPCFGR
jgi:hypothetical protein